MKSTAGLRLEHWPISKLRKARRNPKRHELDALKKSLRRFGFVEPVLLDERTNRLIAGHGRGEALEELHEEGAPAPANVVVRGGEWLVPVLLGWRSRSDREAEALLVAVNRIGEKGGWDDAELAAVLEDVAKAEDGLDGVGFGEKELARLLKQTAKASPPPDDGDVPDPPKRPWVRFGDAFQLGAHRLVCGDSLAGDAVERALGGKRAKAMVTDPPYAIYGSSTGVASDIADDAMVIPFFEAVMRLAVDRLPNFAQAYLFTDWRSYAALWEAAKRAGSMAAKNAIIWDKGGSGLGSNWANTYEILAYYVKVPPQHAMKGTGGPTGMRSVFKPNIFHAYPRPSGEERQHNAAKPVGLLAEVVEAATDKGDLVLEPFAGSGSTLIACERTGRVCAALDKSPKYAQVVITRWEKETGQKHRKL